MALALAKFPTALPRFWPRFPQDPRPESYGAQEPGEIPWPAGPALTGLLGVVREAPSPGPQG